MGSELLLAILESGLTSYLRERAGVQLVFACNLEPDIAACGRVPRRLRASLNLSVDLVVIARGEDAQVVRRRNSRSIASLAVAGREAVFRHGCFLDIIPTFHADQESFVAEGQVNGRDRALEEVDEGADVDVGLLVVEVELSAVGALCWHVVGEDLSFEAFGQIVFELELGVKAVGGSPCLG
jgi:hypothetical protein